MGRSRTQKPPPDVPTFAIGAPVRYQTESMTEEREGTIVRALDTGWQVADRGQKVFVKRTDFIRPVQTGGADSAPPSPRLGVNDPGSQGDVAQALRAGDGATEKAAMPPAGGVLGNRAEAGSPASAELLPAVVPHEALDVVALALRPLPESLAAAEARIRENRDLMQAGATDTARVVAHVRDAFFKTDAPGWLTWCRDRFEIERRQAFRCLAAGRLLISVPQETLARRLAAVDLEKLEMVAGLPPHQQRGFLEHVDLAATTRDALRQKVAMWADPDAGKDDDGAKDTDAKPERRPPEATTLEKLIDRVALLGDTDKLAIVKHLDPAATLRAVDNCLDLVLYQLERENWWTAEQYELFLPRIRAYIERLDTLQRAVTAPVAPAASEG